MFKHRNNIPTWAIAATLIAVVGIAANATAQNGAEKAPPSTSDTKSSSTAQTTAGSAKGAGQTVFRPTETIAPGKPVSFPSDI